MNPLPTSFMGPPATPTRKRIRIDSCEENADNDEIRLFALRSPHSTSPKRIIVDPSVYVPQPHDIVAESWVSDNTMRHVYLRLYDLINYNNPTGVWFPLHMKPSRATWSVIGEEPTKYTHLTVDGRRILFLAVGSIHDCTILIRPNELSPRLRVQLELFRQVDRAAAADLFNSGNSHGKVAPTAMTTLSASTRSDSTVGIPPYKRVYDATQMYAKKSAMSLVEPIALFPGDVVLLELYMVRTEEQVGLTSAAFHLNAVNVLTWGPHPTRVAQLDDQLDFPDVI
ncbi:hypothetical protein L227DRAFT_608085 [Lentinus tigrinus ALCF2SS1-6]|uniref:Uncharacterized protein n=2 Tax=Lentinus tigrinus TaxID=5365 RepID=A0A5C2SMB3_9APHY|nr:hypothetical protein L227DRAFT_608085 [Lentinus tigrinus ALCF2SS1-6]